MVKGFDNSEKFSIAISGKNPEKNAILTKDINLFAKGISVYRFSVI